MPVFISYSRMDGAAVQDLLRDLEKMDLHVWMDGNLRGGDAWWNEILRQIRECDVFVFALSDHSMHSKPCLAEFGYARALGAPIIPVQVGQVTGMRTGPFADIQVVDYRKRDSTSAMELFSALHRSTTAPRPAVDPSVPTPPVPFAYLMRLRSEIDAAELPADVQDRIAADLTRALEDEEVAVRPDIVELMRALRSRPDVSLRVAGIIDRTLTPVGAPSGGSGGAPPRTTTSPPPGGGGPRPPGGPIPSQRAAGPPAAPGPYRPPGASPWPGAQPPPKRSRVPLVIGGVILLAMAAAIGIVLATSSHPAPPATHWTADARAACGSNQTALESRASGGSVAASAYADEIVAMDQSLRNLDAPADVKPRIELMTQAWDQAATDLQRIVADNQNLDPAGLAADSSTYSADNAKGNQIADDLGLSVCAGLGSGLSIDGTR